MTDEANAIYGSPPLSGEPKAAGQAVSATPADGLPEEPTGVPARHISNWINYADLLRSRLERLNGDYQKIIREVVACEPRRKAMVVEPPWEVIARIREAALAAEAALGEVREDAERYRWLRSRMTWYNDDRITGVLNHKTRCWYHDSSDFASDTLDTMIDLARKSHEQ